MAVAVPRQVSRAVLCTPCLEHGLALLSIDGARGLTWSRKSVVSPPMTVLAEKSTRLPIRLQRIRPAYRTQPEVIRAIVLLREPRCTATRGDQGSSCWMIAHVVGCRTTGFSTGNAAAGHELAAAVGILHRDCSCTP